MAPLQSSSLSNDDEDPEESESDELKLDVEPLNSECESSCCTFTISAFSLFP